MRFMKSSYREIQKFQGRQWIAPDRLEDTQTAFTPHGVPGYLRNTHTHKAEKSWSQGGRESNTKEKRRDSLSLMMRLRTAPLSQLTNVSTGRTP